MQRSDVVYPKVYENGQLVSVLNNVTSSKLTETLNAERVFNFSAYEQELKTKYIDETNQVLIKEQFYDINYIEKSHSESGLINYVVSSEHISYRLLNEKYEQYTFVGTPTQIITDLLSGTDFLVGQIDFTTPITFIVSENTNALNLIYRLATLFSGKIEFSELGFKINLLTMPTNVDFEVRVGKNLKNLKVVKDNRGTPKTSYKVDFVNVDESVGFNLKGLESKETGDLVRVYDKAMGVDEISVILKKVTDPIKETTVDIEIVSVLDLYADSFNQLKQAAVIKNNNVYGVKINSDKGMVIERTDKLARSVFNADEFRMQSGDGLGAYSDAIYFDIIDKVYKFIGDTLFAGKVEIANGDVTVRIDPSGSNILEILDGTIELFVVDNAGNATFKADIQTSKNILVGKILQIGSDLSGLNQILFGPTGVNKPSINASSTIMTLFHDNGIALDTNGDLDLNGSITTFGQTAEAIATFDTIDGKTVTVRNGIITDVSTTP